MGNRVCISLKSFLCILRVSCSLIIFDTSNVYAHLHECTVLVLVSSFMQSINEYLYIYIPFVFQIRYDKIFWNIKFPFLLNFYVIVDCINISSSHYSGIFGNSYNLFLQLTKSVIISQTSKNGWCHSCIGYLCICK